MCNSEICVLLSASIDSVLNGAGENLLYSLRFYPLLNWLGMEFGKFRL